ncbi:preprotein translocase subunit SecF [Streptomyces umbrinus]|uniref:Preprotein translocase subunit SecF n=1 Tax=Streptomyces umbrinus TaxID=67370 RepID=A0ABU0SIR3_9ACTN|nr:preprotein translocase subunit SecF [Streptomyces umbrinus]
MLDRVAELTVRWPRAVLVVASVLVAAMSVVGVGAFGKLVGGRGLVLAHVKGDESTREEHAHDIIDTYRGRYEGLTVQAGGGTAVGAELSEQVLKDLLLAEIIAVPVTLLLLLIVFGGVVAALLPLAIGTVAVAGTFAELALLGSVTDVSVFSINLTTALGLGLGIDYALLMISRFREQLASGTSVADAVRTTVHTAGRTVVFSAGTVAVALTALLVFPQYFLRSFAYAGVGVVVIAAVGTLFVMPALLMLLGHRINSGRLPWPRADRHRRRAPFWGRLAGTVMRRPVLTSVPVLAVLLLAAAPLLGVTFGTPDERVLPEDAASRQVSTALQTDFAGDDEAAVQVVADGSVNYEAVDDPAGAGASRRVAVRSVGGGGEGGRELGPSLVEPAADRADRDSARVGYPLVGRDAGAEVTQYQGQSQCGGKLFDGLPDPVPHRVVLQPALRSGVRGGHVQIVDRSEGHGASQQGTGGVAHDHPQPWTDGRRIADVAHAAERGHGRVLEHVVDVGPRSQDAQCHRAHACPVPFEQQTQGSDVTRLRGTREHRVLQTYGVNCVRAHGCSSSGVSRPACDRTVGGPAA